MHAADIMTRAPLTAHPGDRVRDAVERMIAAHISGLPVVDEAGALVGLISEGDLLHRAEIGTGRTRSRLGAFIRGDGALAADYVEAHAVRVEEIMSQDVETVAPDTPLAEVVALMERRRIRRLPVVAAGRLVGIITRADLLKAMVQAGSVMDGVAADLAADQGPPGPDAAEDEVLRWTLLAEIARQPWAPRMGVSVIVAGGLVHLCGTLLVAEQRDALRVLAEQIPGVVAVKDHMVFVEPVSGAFIEAPDGPLPSTVAGGL